jgi:hypothetical protein
MSSIGFLSGLAGLAGSFPGGAEGARAALGVALPPPPPVAPGTAGPPPGQPAGQPPVPGLSSVFGGLPFASVVTRPPVVPSSLGTLPPPPPISPGTAGPPPGQPVQPVRPEFTMIDPAVLGPLLTFPVFQVSKTATELARSAVVQLGDASRDVLQDALNTLSIKKQKASDLLHFLERKVRVGEVLNQLARTWTDPTLGDFADAFQMDRAKTDVMDAIVSIAILNNPQLDEEILAENLPQTGQQDLLDNRVVVDQSPGPGTPLTPPYLILVAVEYRDIASAEDVVRSITGGLEDFQGTKLPQAAAQKLRG